MQLCDAKLGLSRRYWHYHWRCNLRVFK